MADPGFPVGGGVDLVGGAGGFDSWSSYISKILYVEMKESGPLVGGVRWARPLDLPLRFNINVFLLLNTMSMYRHSLRALQEKFIIHIVNLVWYMSFNLFVLIKWNLLIQCLYNHWLLCYTKATIIKGCYIFLIHCLWVLCIGYHDCLCR